MRSLSSSLIQSLMEEDPFKYAHLVKFEKPIKTESGDSLRSATSYVYITDASIDISYDDGSTDSKGIANGSQTYIANRLLDVSGISETIEARASNFSITIGASALNTTFTGSLTIAFSTVYTITSVFSLTELGFLEGDEISITGSPTFTARIDTFTNSNKTASLTILSGTPTVGTYTLTATLSSKDITALLLDKTSSSYARYINREIYVYKAHIDANNGAIIGAPFLLFKGIITSGSFTEDVTEGSKMVWNISSHWGDFVRVNGRITSDSAHRALNNQGFSDRQALIRPDYADDLGFLHSEQALNIIATYKTKETRYKMKKSGLFGLKVKMKEYQVLVDREVDLRFNLEAKYLPVVYGVQRLDTIPFFVDTDKNNPNKVYVAYALCEGEIAGIYDIYFGDQSSVCLDANDESTRSTSTTTNTVDVLCNGRADRGDVLAPQNVDDTSVINYADIWSGFAFAGSNNFSGTIQDRIYHALRGDFSGAVAASPNIQGITHEKGRSFTDPIDCRFIVHTGKAQQKSDTVLMNMAQSNSFKVQGEFYEGDKSQYWGPNHRVLDTAYVVGEFTLSEGEEEIPEVEFVVKGKILECYNYDYSYIHDPLPTYASETTTGIQIGDTVTLKTDAGATITSTAVIADIYTDEFLKTRIRFLADPVLGSNTNFWIAKPGSPSERQYSLVVTDHIQHSGTVPGTLKETIVSTTTSPANNTRAITVSPSTPLGNGANALPNAAYAITGTNFSAWGFNGVNLTEDLRAQINVSLGSNSRRGAGTNSTTITGVSATTNETYTTIISKNGIRFAGTAVATDDYYNGYVIELTRTNYDGSTYVQTRTITDYAGTIRQATVDRDWDPLYFPVNNSAETPTPSFIVQDTYRVYAPDDARVSNNPAIQLLDYITNERYGRGLSVDKDIDLASFKDAARKCDTRSDITVVLTSSSPDKVPTVGDIYEHTTVVSSTTIRLFRGRVSSVTTANGFTEVTFTDVVGKLGKKWVDWKSYTAGDLLWYNKYIYRVTVSGTIAQASLTGSPDKTLSVVNLTKVSGSGPTTLDLDVSTSRATIDGNPLIKKYVSTTNTYISGYSLYDADDVKYWRYVGWNSQDQREVTRHQTNVIVNTSNSVFDNINMLLNHFNGILRYNTGKYQLDIKTQHTSTQGVYGYNQAGNDLTSWSLSFATRSIPNITVPTGCDAAVKISDASGSPPNWHHTSKILPTTTNGDVIVCSAYLKAAEYSSAGIAVRLKDGTTLAYASYDLNGNGAYKELTNALTAGIYSVGSGWYRCWISVNVGSGASAPAIFIMNDYSYSTAGFTYEVGSPPGTGAVGSGIYISSVKVEYNRFLDYLNGPTAYLYYPNIIGEEDIIGAINIEDPGNKDTYNTISVDIPDPRNRFEERSVTYFNSTYLLEDNNVPKKGDMKATGITNYFNARMNAKQYLEESRYGLKINFTMPPKGILIDAGSIIEITNSRLGFVSKPFRVTNITINKDCLVQINADEHTNKSFLIAPSSLGAFTASEPISGIATDPAPVTSPSVSTNRRESILITWTNPTKFNLSTDSVQVWRSNTSSFAGASIIATVRSGAQTYTDYIVSESTSQTYYYWLSVVRETYKKSTNTTLQLTSTYVPSSASPGNIGTALTTNYYSNNDFNSLSPTNPTILSDGTAIDHTLNKDGSANISFEWTYAQGSPLSASNVDGFIVYVKSDESPASTSKYGFGTSPMDESTFSVDPNRRAYVLMGVPSDRFYRFGVRGYRLVDTSINSTGVIFSDIVSPTNATESPYYRPSANVAFTGDVQGTINGTSAATVVANASLGAAVYTNFSSNNDRNALSPEAPVVSPDTNALDHVINTDGSADISFEWAYSPGVSPLAANNIDGFIIYVKSSLTNAAYSFGTSPSDEVTYTVDANRRAFVLQGVPADRHYRFGVRAYRSVDSDVNPTGTVLSNISVPTLTTEGSPTYQPSANVAFAGNVTGTIAGSPASIVVSNANTAFSGTANYRASGIPINIVSPTSITTINNSNATKSIKVTWAAYTQGSTQADVLGLFYRKDNNIPTYSDSCILMNVNINAPGEYIFEGVNPTAQYSFGIAAGRRTELGVEWGEINTTYGTGPFYLYSAPYQQANIAGPATSTLLSIYTPNGDRAYRVTDNSVNFQNAAWVASPSISNPTTERWMAEAWIQQSPSATAYGALRINGGGLSYADVVINYTNGANQGIGGTGSSPEYYIEPFIVDGVTWYKVGVSCNISPGLTAIQADFYPGLISPPQGAYSPDVTASAVIGGVEIRKRTNSSTGFDWTAVSADSVANFTASINNVPAGTVVSNAALGAAVYTNFSSNNDRNAFSPSDPVVSPDANAIDHVINTDGSADISFEWAYSPGVSPLAANNIDGFIVYVKSSLTNAAYNFGTSPMDEVTYTVDANRRAFVLQGVPSNRFYKFGVRGYRSVDSDVHPTGTILSNIVVPTFSEGSPAYQPSANVAFAGDITGTIAGSPASTVVSNANTAFTGTVNYRTNSAPTNNPTIGSPSPSYTSDGNIVVNVPYSYTQGALPADFLIVYYKEGGGATVSPDNPAFATNPSPGNINFTLKPNTNYRFGIQAVRKIESGLIGGSIVVNTSDVSLSSSNFNGNINGTPAGTVVSNASLGASVYTNFSSNNDRNALSPEAPVVSPDTNALDHVINTDGSADISFEWAYSPGVSPLAANNIDGFIVYVKSSLTNAAYSFGTSPSDEVTYTVDANRRAFVLQGVPADRHYRFGVRAYRSVDSDVNPAGTVLSNISVPTLTTEGSPTYQPSANVAFAGNVTGTIAGSPASTVVGNANSAFTGTVNYRTNSAPTNNPTIGTPSPAYTSDGNVVVNVPYSYTQGALPADFLIVYYKEGGGTVVSPDNPGFATNPSPGNINFTLKPNTTYRFGMQAVRKIESGLAGGSIVVNASDITLSPSNFTGNINNVPAATVTTAITNFNTSNDRNATSPTAPTVTNTIGDFSPIVINPDGTCDITFNWSYTQGSPLAANNVDGFIIYVKSNPYPRTYTFTGSETSVVIPATTASTYGYTLKSLPAAGWHNVGVRGYRVVDSDVAAAGTIYSNITQSTYNTSRGITSSGKFPVGVPSNISSISPVWDNLYTTDDYTNAAWTKTRVTASPSTLFAPDGKTLAYQIVEDTSNNTHVLLGTAFTPTAGRYTVFKLFVKPKGDRGINITYPAVGFGAIRTFRYEFDSLNTVVPAGGYMSVRALPDSWYEIHTMYQAVSPNSSQTNIQLYNTDISPGATYGGDGVSGLYVSNIARYELISPTISDLFFDTDVIGSTWYDTVNKSLKIWNGSRWVESSTVGAVAGSNLLTTTGSPVSTASPGLAGIYFGHSVLKIYDATNVLRVKIGDLSA